LSVWSTYFRLWKTDIGLLFYIELFSFHFKSDTSKIKICWYIIFCKSFIFCSFLSLFKLIRYYLKLIRYYLSFQIWLLHIIMQWTGIRKTVAQKSGIFTLGRAICFFLSWTFPSVDAGFNFLISTNGQKSLTFLYCCVHAFSKKDEIFKNHVMRKWLQMTFLASYLIIC
jgi:hypothetical protein